MTSPYRGSSHACPACNAPLRSFRERWACDACDGIFLPYADVIGAVHELTSIEPGLSYVKERPGPRACPLCAAEMLQCELRLALEHETCGPEATLDRCAEHGIWFDATELAAVFETVSGKGYGGGVGRKQVVKDARATQPAPWTAHFRIGGIKGGWG